MKNSIFRPFAVANYHRGSHLLAPSCFTIRSVFGIVGSCGYSAYDGHQYPADARRHVNVEIVRVVLIPSDHTLTAATVL